MIRMIKSQHPRRFRTVVRLLLGLAAIWLLYDIGMNIMAWHFIKQLSKDHPNLAVVPVSPPTNRQAKLHGTQLAAFGYSIQVPWEDIDTRREIGSMETWFFKNSAAVTMFRPTKADYQVGLLRTFKNYQRFKSLMGPHTLSSDYDLLDTELKTTPAQIHWWSTRAAKARALVLLTMKWTAISDSRSVYIQSNSQMRGFQLNDLPQDPSLIEIDLFDRDNRRYRIWVQYKNANQTFVTQTQINALVASIKPQPQSK